MPKIIHKTPARKTRTRTKARGAEYDIVRDGRKGAADAPAFIADSIHTLNLQPKSGAQVFYCFRGEDDSVHENIREVYNDLYASYARIYESVKGEKTCDLAKLGIDMHVSLGHMLAALKNGLLPSGYDFNIEHDERCPGGQEYFFVICHPCRYSDAWEPLEVGPALLKLAKRNKALHALFLSFLKALNSCGISLWNEGFMGGAMDYIHNLIYEYKASGSPEEIEAAKKLEIDFKAYDTGVVSQYARAIRRAKVIKPSEMRRRAKLFKNDTEIANLICQGAYIIEQGYKLYNYCYDPDYSENHGWDIYLDLESTCNIVWDLNDNISIEHMEHLDQSVNNGYVQSPIWHRAVTGKTKKFDFSQFAGEIRWPGELVGFLGRARTLIDKYKKKK